MSTSKPEFVEFAGKKEYKCPRCKAIIRYAKFFGPDKKILTTDGKEPYFDKDRKPMSNTGWPTNPETKQMHECSPKSIPESELKRTDTLDGSGSHRLNPQPLTDMDKKVRDRIIEDAYISAKFLIWKLRGVEKACDELNIESGAKSGMIFNQVCAEDRSLKEHGE